MEQPSKDKRGTGQSVAFYTALAVCLIAVGVGTWQLLRPEESGQGVSAVSSAVTLPPSAGEASVSGPDADPEPIGPDPETVTEDVSTWKPGGAKSDAAASPSAESDASGNKAASDTKQSTSGGKQSSDTKQSTSSGGKSSDTKQSTSSGGKSSDTKQSTSSEGKSSGTKQSASSGGKSSGDAVRPVEGTIVTGFSMDKLLYNETMRDWRTHDGIDIAADAGTAVAAAKAGTVESVAADPIMGTTVVIRHADKWESVYSSLTDMPEVEAGDDVTAGQVIGYVGTTAASESALGPHLHFTVLNDGTPVDPEAFLS